MTATISQPAPDADIPTLIRRIAGWMLHEGPRGTVTSITLEDQARHVSWTHLHHAAGRGRVNPIACDTLTETVLAALPKPRSGDTRSEYARRILDADPHIYRPAMTPFDLSLDGALLLSLIHPLHLTGTIVEAYEAADGLVTVESTPNGDFDIVAWAPLSVRAAEEQQLEALIDPDLDDPDGRLPLIHGVWATDVAALDDVASAVQRAREYLLDIAAQAASYVRRPAMTP